jgi:hypothetical protein
MSKFVSAQNITVEGHLLRIREHVPSSPTFFMTMCVYRGVLLRVEAKVTIHEFPMALELQSGFARWTLEILSSAMILSGSEFDLLTNGLFDIIRNYLLYPISSINICSLVNDTYDINVIHENSNICYIADNIKFHLHPLHNLKWSNLDSTSIYRYTLHLLRIRDAYAFVGCQNRKSVSMYGAALWGGDLHQFWNR